MAGCWWCAVVHSFSHDIQKLEEEESVIYAPLNIRQKRGTTSSTKKGKAGKRALIACKKKRQKRRRKGYNAGKKEKAIYRRNSMGEI